MALVFGKTLEKTSILYTKMLSFPRETAGDCDFGKIFGVGKKL